MAITRVNSASITGSGTTTAVATVPVGTGIQAGDLLVVVGNSNGTHVLNGMSVQDSVNGTAYTKILETQLGSASSRYQSLHVFQTPGAIADSSTITLTGFAAASASDLSVDVFRGATATIDKAAVGSSNASGATSAAPALASNATAGALVITACSCGSGTLTSGSPFTTGSTGAGNASTGLGFVLSATGALTYASTWTLGTANTSAAQTVSFTAATSGSVQPAPRLTQAKRGPVTWRAKSVLTSVAPPPVRVPAIVRAVKRVTSRGTRSAISRPAFIPVVTVTIPVVPASVRTRRTIPRLSRSRITPGIVVTVAASPIQPVPASVRTRRALARQIRTRVTPAVSVTVQPVPAPVRTRRIFPRPIRSRITPGIVVTASVATPVQPVPAPIRTRRAQTRPVPSRITPGIVVTVSVAGPVQPIPAPVRTRRIFPRLTRSRITPGIVIPPVVVTIPVVPAPVRTRRFARSASRGRVTRGFTVSVAVPVPIIPAPVKTRRTVPGIRRGRITPGVVVVIVITPPPAYGTSRVTGAEILAWITGATDKIRVTGQQEQSSETEASQAATSRVTGREI